MTFKMACMLASFPSKLYILSSDHSLSRLSSLSSYHSLSSLTCLCSYCALLMNEVFVSISFREKTSGSIVCTFIRKSLYAGVR